MHFSDFAPDENDLRLESLHDAIEENFSHLAPDEVEILANDYDDALTTMIEITEVLTRYCAARLFHDEEEDGEFFPVVFPSKVHVHLEPGDVFLTTLGLRDKKWNVLWTSTPYQAVPH